MKIAAVLDACDNTKTYYGAQGTEQKGMHPNALDLVHEHFDFNGSKPCKIR